MPYPDSHLLSCVLQWLPGPQIESSRHSTHLFSSIRQAVPVQQQPPWMLQVLSEGILVQPNETSSFFKFALQATQVCESVLQIVLSFASALASGDIASFWSSVRDLALTAQSALVSQDVVHSLFLQISPFEASHCELFMHWMHLAA